ncbi:MAG: hypothetical protein COT74_08680 [Bdellovibrionales bacterium CG10_big_fil_rev_8_21_14_0_10_45_34]|nr:MAG: hypothetical protein COT74_08680 [Bdellovibrionales bacterium CG10_big_fil_rev_8_21_14_0_10_45_34]
MVVAMAVVSGVESLLKQAVMDVTGHILVMKPVGFDRDDTGMSTKLEKFSNTITGITPFLHIEGLSAHKGVVSGVVLQGVDPSSVGSVLNLRNRVLESTQNAGAEISGFDRFLQASQGSVLVGKELAKKLSLSLDDDITLIIPRATTVHKQGFTRQIGRFKVVGFLDLGKYEFNERYIMMNIQDAQELAKVGKTISGYRLKISDPSKAQDVGFDINRELGHPYWTRDWMEVSRNYFSAVTLEKTVLFIVLLFVVMIASFNVSSALFVHVLRRFSDISLLRTFGMSQKSVARVFSLQGLIVGVFGVASGLLFGLFLTKLVEISTWLYVPAEIYKFDHLPIELRWLDWLLIISASLLLCWVSSLAPARRASRMNPVEGIRYE